ncbi:single-stranded DNA-binding protein [Geminocystis sp. NIES-3709]|uniref:single-stranded DNA-binding protein n=1 Tax=Geminocystis sp. NIES-3709 TaxID=1617448 RepID=UPI0005FCB583|nr:single-stranded DNA-binding protein [Geminocystis sp. NIES-3709]BAQ66101.1 single-stranded DNA-binding protein [Geminocystis sp. NIES-3709]
MTLNIVHLVGRAGSNPEIRYFDSGKILCKFNIAVNRRKKDEQPDWFELEIWDKTAEIAANYVKKGSLVGIQGSLKIDTWNDRNSGDKRSKPLIRVNNLDLLGSKRDNENNSNSGGDEF